MGRKRSYPTAFRQQMVALVRSGRSANDLAKEFEPTAQTISAWVRQADRDEGRREDGLTSRERSELQRLRKEISACVKSARSLQKPRPGSHGRPMRYPQNLQIYKSASGRLSHHRAMPNAGRLHQWVLCVVSSSCI